MKYFSQVKTFLFTFLIFSSISFAQGALQGIVTDSLSNEQLVGANIILSGTSLGAASDLDGKYRIAKIPEGTYDVRVSYIGYKYKIFSITIASNKTTELNVQLTPDVIEGNNVVILGQALGQAAAINQQLSSNTIVNIVSEQKIKELPDANAAESIGRLPGVSLTRSGGEASQIVMRGLSSKFSNITIDGVRVEPTNGNDRGVDLSTISQGTLAGIELFKALTSDKDADALAGTVNLVTRKAPSERVIKFEARGNYNGVEKSAEQYNFNARYSERFFDKLLGVQVTGNLERTIRSDEVTDYDYESLNQPDNWSISEFNVTYDDEVRKREGASLLLDFNTPDNGSIRFNTVFNQTTRDYLTHNRNYHQSGGVEYDYRNRKHDLNIFSSSLHGENYLWGFEIDWNLSYSQSRVNPIVDYELQFSESSTNSSGMQNVPANLYRGPVEDWVPYAFNNFSVASLYLSHDRSSGNFDKGKTAFLNILRKYTLTNEITGEFKFGGKYKSRYRSHDEYDAEATYYLWEVPEYTKLADGTFVKKDFSGTRFDGLVKTSAVSLSHFLNDPPDNRNVFDNYALYPLIDRDAIEQWRSLNINGYRTATNVPYNTNAEYAVNNGTVANGYMITERITAGYLMNTLNLGTLATVITGVRVESDNNDYFCLYSPKKLGGFNWAPYGVLQDANVNHKESTVLPNFQMIIKPTDFMNIRLAAYQALARPDFNQRLPRFVAAAASSPYLHVGNPDLKNAVAWNYEIQTQFYSNDLGLFSINVFYKDIKNIVHNLDIQTKGSDIADSLGVNWQLYTDTYPFDSGSQYNLEYAYNSSKPTKVWGFEVEHQANFRYLPGLLKNIVLDYNFTIIRSETWMYLYKSVDVPRPPFPPLRQFVIFENHQKLEDQPEFRANASLGYDIAGFSFRLSYAYQGSYTSSFSGDRNSDYITNSFSRWDIAMTQQVTDYLKVILNLNNITNAREGNSILNLRDGWPELANTSRLYGFTMDFGARLEL